MYGEPIFEKVNVFDKCGGASRVQASGDMGGVLIRTSTAGALIFSFSVNEGEHSVSCAKVGYLLGDENTKHFWEGLHYSVHSTPIYEIKVVRVDDTSSIEKMSCHLFPPMMRELPPSQTSKFLSADLYPDLFEWESIRNELI